MTKDVLASIIFAKDAIHHREFDAEIFSAHTAAAVCASAD
jgi:hypothetical protein